MLEVTVIPDSPVADIFASKCCGGGLPDQNLEVRILNRDSRAVRIQSRFRLEGDEKALDWDAVCPAGGRYIAPGEVAALYANMDPILLDRYRYLVLFDDSQRPYRIALRDASPARAAIDAPLDDGAER